MNTVLFYAIILNEMYAGIPQAAKVHDESILISISNSAYMKNGNMSAN